MDTPDETVRAFIAAYRTWNDIATARIKPLVRGSVADQKASALTESEYEGLIALFCTPSVVSQGGSFGDESMHEPDRETIESVSLSGDEAIVRTRHTGLRGFVSEYEYRLTQASGGWRIASLLYLDEDGKYECL